MKKKTKLFLDEEYNRKKLFSRDINSKKNRNEREKWEMVKRIKSIFIMLLCASMLWGCGKSESTTETVSESAPKDLRELNEECITVETGSAVRLRLRGKKNFR